MNANIAVIGMGVMGSCLALNMANHKFKVSVYNYTPDLTDKFIKNHPHENITAYYDIPSLVQSVARPRKFFIMVTAGKAVDAVIDSLLPYLEADDIIMDGGNWKAIRKCSPYWKQSPPKPTTANRAAPISAKTAQGTT